MINPTTLSTRLAGLVGFRQSFNPEYAILDSQNTTSRSGYIVNDNPFVKIETVKDSQDYAGIQDIDFNTWLRQKISTSIINVANAVFSDNDIIDRQMIYKHALNKISQTSVNNNQRNAQGNFVNCYDNPAGFQCYWIQVSQEKNVAFKIERVFLEFNGTGTINLYLFNTADLTTPLFVQSVNVTQPFQEVQLDWVCDNSTLGKGYKGDYYLGYFTADCPNLKPFKREYREAVLMSEIDCITYYRSSFVNFTSLEAPFDLMGFSPYVFYNGINPDITVYNDYTDLIIQNEKLFARAIQIDLQISLISESIASIRSNRNERISGQYAATMMSQIEGESGEGNVKVKGLRPEFYGAIAKIKKELKKLSEGYEGDGLILVQTLT